MAESRPSPEPTPATQRSVLLLICILAVGAILRFAGQDWDSQTHMHPDERFLTMVETGIQLPENLTQYFDTQSSPLNPHNKGHTFFVYGTLPIFLVRILGEWAGETGYDQIHLIGRAASASFDLLSLVLVFLIGSRLYSRRVGLLAAAFSAFSVLLIQHAHFFVVDSFANTFSLAGIYFAVRALDDDGWLNFSLFGLALGMASASKISAAPLAGVIVLTSVVRLWGSQDGLSQRQAVTQATRLLLAAIVSLMTFRLLQPYAFKPFSMSLNPAWLDNLAELTSLVSARSDFPPAQQWANRTPVLFSLENLVVYGLGWPLGLLAWFGWAWALVRSMRGDWQRHLILVAWTAGFFLLRSIGTVTSMRYEIPVYPTLALLAAWGLWDAWERLRGIRIKGRLRASWLVACLGMVVLAATATYALAFARNYTLPFTRYEASQWIYRNVPGPANIVMEIDGVKVLEPMAFPEGTVLNPGEPVELPFTARVNASAVSVLLPHPESLSGQTQATLRLTLLDETGSLGQATNEAAVLTGSRLEISLDDPVNLEGDRSYRLRLEVLSAGSVSLRGSVIISESSWDDFLPLPIEGRNGYGGLYGSVNQELYWSDGEDTDGTGQSDKMERILSTLNEGDYLVITSNRQYGSVGRIPQKFPLTVAYYRALVGCPSNTEVEVCMANARPGEIEGRLGYELVVVFERNPSLGPFTFRDQAAEEAFTVYDHPKVMVFYKSPSYDSAAVLAELSRVDLTHIVNLPPGELGAPETPTDLLIPEDRLEAQRSGGTWSDLFSRNSLINRWEPLAVVAWWLMVGVLGLFAFPIVRAAFPGLVDGGYPLARLIGLLLVAWASWLLASTGIAPYTRGTILTTALAMASLSAVLAWRDREGLLSWLRERRREIAWVELFALGFFLFDLAIRLGNPDLWHRYLGGEKPMDFSYLNAVLKSTTFPPFDPWYAGGYINYYYFGFVFVATPIKMLQVVPSVGYNLALPTLFALAALAAYAVGSNLVARRGTAYSRARVVSPRVAGLAAAISLLVIGNLGTVRLIYDGLREVGLRGSEGPKPGLLAAAAGLERVLTLQETLPVGGHHWYWDPSRAIPTPPGDVGPITEFPFFTFLYADLHAHLINLPLTVLTLAWGLSWVLAAEKKLELTWKARALGIGVGALTLGVLAPTNTWDFPAYWTLGAAAALAAPFLRSRRIDLRSVVEGGLSVAGLLLLANLLYRPYYLWYGAGYTEADFWQGARTSLDGYLTVHGLFLVILIPWMGWETRQWLASTPLSALSRLRPYFPAVLFACFAFLLGLAYLAVSGVQIAPLVGPIVVWSGLLLLRKNTPIEKRVALAMVGTAAALTFLVEVVVLVGDIGRMNTVFKFYFQVWTLFSLAGSAALVWLVADPPAWGLRVRLAWTVAFGAVLFGAALYPLTATRAKIEDRMTPATRATLDGMAFMAAATYDDLGKTIPLEGDYQAIQWVQENIQGSPVIVEAQIPEYRWGSRFAIYTGLPAVLGWNWHQRQQRAAVADLDVTQRSQEITDFYLTTSTEAAQRFLDRYDVRYIIVGGLERLYYAELDQCTDLGAGAGVSCNLAGRLEGFATLEVPADHCTPNGSNGMLNCPTGGLDKFERMVDQGLMRAVYRNGNTTIYEVAS